MIRDNASFGGSTFNLKFNVYIIGNKRYVLPCNKTNRRPPKPHPEVLKATQPTKETGTQPPGIPQLYQQHRGGPEPLQ